MERVERVLDLTKKLNAKGMLAEELAWLGRAATFGEDGWEQREWFQPRIKEKVREWAKAQEERLLRQLGELTEPRDPSKRGEHTNRMRGGGERN